MRWRFPHSSETAARALALGRIDAWWRAFGAAVPRLEALFRRRDAWDLAGWMREHLGSIDERIMWEFGPGTRGGDGHRLVLTPEGEHRLRPLVEAVLARAPELPRWEFHAHRLAEALPTALQAVAERTSFDFTGWSARASAVGAVACGGTRTTSTRPSSDTSARALQPVKSNEVRSATACRAVGSASARRWA